MPETILPPATNDVRVSDASPDPMKLSTTLIALIETSEDEMRDAGLKPYFMRRSLETAVEAYRTAVASGDPSAIEKAEDAANGRAARCAEELAAATIRLLKRRLDAMS